MDLIYMISHNCLSTAPTGSQSQVGSEVKNGLRPEVKWNCRIRIRVGIGYWRIHVCRMKGTVILPGIMVEGPALFTVIPNWAVLTCITHSSAYIAR
jgi:hypothetical protein